ncbi:MAG: hypothetical protein ACI9U2_003799 [Bradymonadia bacterium]|jgi:hypothetical protein
MTLLLLTIALLTPPPAIPAPPMDCGYTPVWREPSANEAVYRGQPGCGMAPQTPNAWQTVTSIDLARVYTGPTHTRVELVFLNAHFQRVLPIGRSVRYDMQFTRKKTGTIMLKAHRDGVFQLDLPRGKRTGKCDTHLFLYFKNGTQTLRHWLDDWLLLC